RHGSRSSRNGTAAREANHLKDDAMQRVGAGDNQKSGPREKENRADEKRYKHKGERRTAPGPLNVFEAVVSQRAGHKYPKNHDEREPQERNARVANRVAKIGD